MQPHQRHLVGEGEFLRVDALSESSRVRRAALHGEVLAADGNPPPVHLGKAEHVVRGLEIDEISLLVEMRHAGPFAHLLKGVFVGQRRNPFAHGQAALFVVPLHGFLAALALRKLAAEPDLVGFLFPAHVSGGPPCREAPKP